jgi:hypothetical protein
MSYCMITDVQALNPKRTYNTTSTPTSSQVNTLIDLIAGKIDTVLLSLGYSGTISGPAELLDSLKLLNALGAAALAEMGMFPEISEKGSTPHWKALQQMYEDGLEALKNGELPDSMKELISDGSVAGFYTEMTDQGDFPEPVFKKRSEDLEF